MAISQTTPAVIANTAGLGVTTYLGPRRVDRVNGSRLAWPVWDKLSNGSWAPDIYTSLP